MESILEDAYVLISAGKISALAELLPILEKVSATSKPLLIIAEDIEGTEPMYLRRPDAVATADRQ